MTDERAAKMRSSERRGLVFSKTTFIHSTLLQSFNRGDNEYRYIMNSLIRNARPFQVSGNSDTTVF